jgi:hypothetical protein
MTKMGTLFSAEYRECRKLHWTGEEALCTEVLVVEPQFLYVSQLAEYIDNISGHQMTVRNIQKCKLWALVIYMLHCHACQRIVRRNVYMFQTMAAKYVYKTFVFQFDSLDINMLQIWKDIKQEGND